MDDRLHAAREFSATLNGIVADATKLLKLAHSPLALGKRDRDRYVEPQAAPVVRSLTTRLDTADEQLRLTVKALGSVAIGDVPSSTWGAQTFKAIRKLLAPMRDGDQPNRTVISRFRIHDRRVAEALRDLQARQGELEETLIAASFGVKRRRPGPQLKQPPKGALQVSTPRLIQSSSGDCAVELPDGAFLSVTDLAEWFGVNPNVLRKALRKWRNSHMNSDWQRTQNPRPNDPRFRYRVGSVRPLVNELQRSADGRPKRKVARKPL